MIKLSKAKVNIDIHAAIREAVQAGIKAGKQEPRNIFKQTEARLRAYPILKINIKEYEKDIEDLNIEQVTRRSKDIVKFTISQGVRLSPEEIQQAKILELEMKLDRDKKEILEIESALATIHGDEYENIIYLRYFNGMYTDEIANQIHCGESTVKRNSNRLVRKMAIKLYGADAL
ncbi:hypothetical protein LJC10_00590 [Selenomonadales bacterium OttesenSCG-928-I06]|nr:hypothetical protein [Selenomonadales bacterium OttesenSCG-928-I06]